MSSLDRQNLTFTGKRKDDAESTDQAPKRTKNTGRPPILTASQKCKLARLYLFTNLEVDGIGKLLGFRHKTPKKRTLQNILHETLAYGYHCFRPKDKAARKNRSLQVGFTRPDKASDSSSQQSPRFRIITATSARLRNSGSDFSNPSGANSSDGISKDSPAQRDATGIGASTHDDDPDWINLVHWDEDYVCQQSLLQEARGERKLVNEDDTRVKIAVAMTLPSQSSMQLTYTLDDLQEDIKRFVKEGRVDLDGLLTDSMDTGTVTEDPVPTFEPGRSLTKEIFPSSFNRLNISPQTQCRDNHSSMASYGGISSVIQQLSNCSTGHKSDIRYAFRATAGSQRAPANYNIPGPTTICEDMVQDSKSTLYKVPGDEMMQNSEAALYQALANFIFPQGNISFLPADHIMWNLFDHAVAMDRSFTRIPFTGITTVLTRAIRDPFSTQHSTDCLEDLKSNDGMDRFGSTLLHLAAVNGGNFTILNTLITNANINRVNSLGETFMHVVQPRAIGDEMPILTQTLEGLNFPFTQRDHKGRTCIHVLLGNGAYLEHLASYAHLLKITNAEWDRRLIPDEDPWGFRDLISNGREDLQPGWEELQRNSCKCHSWHTCRAYRELDVDEYYCNGEPELMKACWKNDPSLSQDYYEDLIAEGANVHYRNWNRETPLLLAVMTGNVKATRVLLRHRSNVHARIGRSGILRWASWWRRKFVGSECYANIIACEALVIDAGAVMFPTMFDEWDFKADHF